MKRRGRTILACVLAATAALAWLGCGSIKDGWEDKPGPPRVLASFPPIDCFVKNVGGDHVGLICLCTDIGPHDYQFNIQDSVKLKRADLFFTNGLGLDDHFADRMVANSSNARLRPVPLAAELPASLRKKGEAHAHDHGHEGHDHDHGHGHHHGEYDPHVWLGIPQAIGMVEQIREGLKEKDRAHAGDYDKNASAYIARLKALHAEGKKKLKGLKVPVITFHESMGYFADSFGLNVIGSIQPTPGESPSPQKYRDLVKKCAGQARVIIAVEPQYPETAAETLKKALTNAGVKEVPIVVVDPLETLRRGDELDAGWYERNMKANLDNLAKHAQ
jgi:ABC-type Zn uptake system ZnuABC Zn-binding protein ZnuA